MAELKRGRFICIEGLEGAGKTTVMDAVIGFLKKHNIDALKTNEPCSDDEICASIRELLKRKTSVEMVKAAEYLLFYASRAQSVASIVEPALNSGAWVVSDRHDWSTIAYQSYGGGADLKTLSLLREVAIGDLKPDFTIYIDIDPRVGMERARCRGELDRIELKDISFFEKARNGFKKLVSENSSSSVMIDGSMTKEEVANAVINALSNHFCLHP